MKNWQKQTAELTPNLLGSSADTNINKGVEVVSKDASLSGLLKTTGIQRFLDDKNNTEIAINRPYELWTESSQGWQRYDMPSLDFRTLLQISKIFAIFNGGDITTQNPIVSGVFPEGQRGQVVIPSAVENGTVSVTIRQPSITRFALDDYINSGRTNDWIDKSDFQTKFMVYPEHLMNQIAREKEQIDELNRLLGIPEDVNLELYELQMLKAKADRDIKTFIRLAVKHKQNLCLIGATGSGKTTFTKAICDLVPFDTRIVTIEDTAELDLPKHLNRVHMFYKDVSPKDLLRSCMRMKPDRIFLTELRGDEAYDYLNALNTGHGGSVTTVHANDCQSAYYRIATLIKNSEIGKNLDMNTIIADVFTTIDVMIFMKYTKISEIAYDPIRKYRLLKGKKI